MSEDIGVVEVSAGGGGGRASLAARRSAQLPKLRDLLKKHRGDSFADDLSGEPDLNFEYGDCDTYSAELAELYTYSEVPEFASNAEAYCKFIVDKKLHSDRWSDYDRKQKSAIVMELLESLELSDKHKRLDALRSVLYLLQGTFQNCDNVNQIIWFGVENTYLLYELGCFGVLCDVLALEIEEGKGVEGEREEEGAEGGNSTVTMEGNLHLRVVLSALYHMVETLRRDCIDELGNIPEEEENRRARLRKNFKAELGETMVGNELLPVALFRMTIRFCAMVEASYPMRKVLLLLWKVLLGWLGGWDTLREAKIKKRRAHDLSKGEDTVLVASTMRSAAPPIALNLPGAAMGGDLDGLGGSRRSRPPLAKRQMACSNSEEEDNTEEEEEGGYGNESDCPDSAINLESGGPGGGEDTPRPSSPTNSSTKFPEQPIPPPRPQVQERTFVWAPKIRPQEVEAFLETERMKFFGFQIPGDSTTTAGLPKPIIDSVNALRRHVYVSLGDIQAKREEALNKYFFSQKEEQKEGVEATEELYRHILPELPQHMIALLKLLLSAFPSTQAKTDSITILSDCLPPHIDPALLSSSLSLNDDVLSTGAATSSVSGLEQSLRLGIDVKRHKEVIVKATSAILILLVKHFRLNHIYQFEYMSQHLVFANCIPLILKFFDQNIQNYIQSKNELAPLNFPHVLLAPQPIELSLETLEFHIDKDNCKEYFLWRNLFSAINQLRLLNKLTKWKHARTMMLVVFKSAPIMKRALRVRHILLQLFALKILKMQSKHLGRQWRKTNMEIMSAIYSKVRHRMNDDWAYGNENQNKGFDFQAEESSLRLSIESFHLRRYGSSLAASTALSSMSGSGGLGGSLEGPQANGNNAGRNKGTGSAIVEVGRENFYDPEFIPYDNNIISVLGREFKLTERFKVGYEKWLEQEVFKASIDWEQLLAMNRGSTAA